MGLLLLIFHTYVSILNFSRFMGTWAGEFLSILQEKCHDLDILTPAQQVY